MILVVFKGLFTFDMVRQASLSTASITSMVFVLLLGAAVFSIVFRMLGGDDLVHEILSSLPGGAMGALIVVMAVMFVLGFILDTFESSSSSSRSPRRCCSTSGSTRYGSAYWWASTCRPAS